MSRVRSLSLLLAVGCGSSAARQQHAAHEMVEFVAGTTVFGPAKECI